MQKHNEDDFKDDSDDDYDYCCCLSRNIQNLKVLYI